MRKTKVRKIALNVLKSLDSKKSINVRHKKCHYDAKFRTEVFESLLRTQNPCFCKRFIHTFALTVFTFPLEKSIEIVYNDK